MQFKRKWSMNTLSRRKNEWHYSICNYFSILFDMKNNKNTNKNWKCSTCGMENWSKATECYQCDMIGFFGVRKNNKGHWTMSKEKKS